MDSTVNHNDRLRTTTFMGEVTCYIQYSSHAGEKKRLLEQPRGEPYQCRTEMASGFGPPRRRRPQCRVAGAAQLWALLAATGCGRSAAGSHCNYLSDRAASDKPGAG